MHCCAECMPKLVRTIHRRRLRTSLSRGGVDYAALPGRCAAEYASKKIKCGPFGDARQLRCQPVMQSRYSSLCRLMARVGVSTVPSRRHRLRRESVTVEFLVSWRRAAVPGNMGIEQFRALTAFTSFGLVTTIAPKSGYVALVATKGDNYEGLTFRYSPERGVH